MAGTPLAKSTRHAPVAKTVRHAPMAKESPTPMAKVVRHLEAGEWASAHALAQKDSTPLGCWAHGIVHLIEGDLDNAKYWYRRAHRPPLRVAAAPGARRPVVGPCHLLRVQHA